MNELYMIYGMSMLKVGTLVGVDDVDTWDQLKKDNKTPRRFVLHNVSLEASRALYALQASALGTRWAWGQEDGTLAPSYKTDTESPAAWMTIYGTIDFDLPTTRTFFTFAEKVHDLGYRQSDKGVEIVLHLTNANWHNLSEKA